MTHRVIGDIVPLGSLLETPPKNGYSPICPNESTGKWVLGLSALSERRLDLSAAKPAPLDEPRVDRFLLHPGDFLISRSNTLDKVGKVGVFRGGLNNCSYPDLMMRFRPDTSKILPDYLEVFLRSEATVKYIKSRATGTSGSMKKINQATVEAIPILLLKPNAQKKIAAIHTTWDTAIEETERLIEAKEKRLSWLIKSLIENRCEHWEHLRVGKMFASISEKHNGDEDLLSVTQDRGVIPRTMLQGRVMSPEGSTDSYKLIKKGDFAISLRSFQGGIEYSRYQGLISPAYTVLRPRLKIDDEFYRHFFKSYLFIEKYLNIAVIGIRDGKQISIPDFMTVKIPYPSLEQQQQIAETLNTARQEIDLLKKQAEAYRKQKRGLMQKLLTGKWRVNVD